MPFMFEGSMRGRSAEGGLEELREQVDALVVIQNNRLVHVVQKNTSMADAFKAADMMLLNGVRGITDLITSVGFVNVDFADVRSIMEHSGTAIMGVGVAGGEGRAEAALQQAASSPLIDIPLEGASGILVNVAGGQDLGIHEIQTVVNELKRLASPDARIVFGAVVDPNPLQTLSVTLIATGFGEGGIPSRDPWSRRTANADVAAAPRATAGRGQVIERVAREPVGAPTATATQEPPAAAEPEIREVTQPVETDPENSEVPAFIRRQRQDQA
jgi:cell division protein FtsZ